MQWSDVRHRYPNEWLIIEALTAHTTSDNRRELDDMAVVERCMNGSLAIQNYCRLHHQYPERELYYIHTSRENLNIRERRWLGIRSGHETVADR